ncbi:MAG: lysophospholipid acyltransferase family protein [Kiritimatiellae bacterium]|nr:lysophospholipid acyltransferase family protein [Kiritimatiellia bacterium]
MNFIDRHAYDWGAKFARAIFPLFRRRRRIAIENILKAGITDDPEEAARIARASWGHLAGHICEALRVPHVVTKDNWREHLDFSVVHPDTARLLLDQTDQPILLVSSHHGVWEAATNILSFARPMIAIARVMNNKLVANWMKNHHFRGPVTVIDKNHGFTPDIMRQWVTDRAAMTILMDQHTSKGLPLQFLGRPAKTFSSATRLAMRTGYPIVVGSFVRIAPYTYRLVGEAPVSFTKDSDKAANTQLLNDRLGEAIRQYPEQYLWAHRRWRE